MRRSFCSQRYRSLYTLAKLSGFWRCVSHGFSNAPPFVSAYEVNGVSPAALSGLGESCE